MRCPYTSRSCRPFASERLCWIGSSTAASSTYIHTYIYIYPIFTLSPSLSHTHIYIYIYIYNALTLSLPHYCYHYYRYPEDEELLRDKEAKEQWEVRRQAIVKDLNGPKEEYLEPFYV